MPRSAAPPCSRSGGMPSRVSIRAPISSSGSVTRRIGRLDNEESPTSVLSNACPASKPASSRMPVPALPQSIGCVAPRRPCSPAPCTMRSPSDGASIRTPSWASTAAVARVSSPSRKPRIRERPSAMAASIRARCEIDLSPGTRTLPCNGPAAWLLQSHRVFKATPPDRIPARGSSRPIHRCRVRRPAGRRHRYVRRHR